MLCCKLHLPFPVCCFLSLIGRDIFTYSGSTAASWTVFTDLLSCFWIYFVLLFSATVQLTSSCASSLKTPTVKTSGEIQQLPIHDAFITCHASLIALTLPLNFIFFQKYCCGVHLSSRIPR